MWPLHDYANPLVWHFAMTCFREGEEQQNRTSQIKNLEDHNYGHPFLSYEAFRT